MTDFLRNSDDAARERVYELADAILSNTITAEDARCLNELVCNDAEARRHYVRFMFGSTMLRQWGCDWAAADAGSRGEQEMGDSAAIGFNSPYQQATIDNQPSAIPPIILDLSPAIHSPLLTLHSPVGNFLLSYTTSALVLGLLLLACWTWRIQYEHRPVENRSMAANGHSDTPAPKQASSVGRITGLADCRWKQWVVDSGQWVVGSEEGLEVRGQGAGVSNPQSATPNPLFSVPLGARYALASGLMEITYHSGAKVILQGPCTYEVESARGGFLSFGKLTARVEKKGSGGRVQGSGVKGERTANLALSQEGRQPTASLAPRSFELVESQESRVESRERSASHESGPRLSTLNSGLFFVRTPTAVVTDLGTEFGVEVDRSGASRANVFQGKVELRLADGDDLSASDGAARSRSGDRVILLRANESAEVTSGDNGAVRVIRKTGQSKPSMFVRQMPSGTPIKLSKLFSTGLGLKLGEADSHWLVVARSDDPHFKPRQAVVVPPLRGCPPNDPTRSQWISAADNLPEPPPKILYTFRTTFEVAGLTPGRTGTGCQLVVDDHVVAIRVNGFAAVASGRQKPALYGGGKSREFLVRGSCLLPGANTMELDVLTDPSASRDVATNPNSAMLRMEMNGTETGNRSD